MPSDPRSGPNPPEDVVALWFQGTPILLRDVIDAAWFRGDLDPWWASVLRVAAQVSQADALGQAPDPAALQSLSDEFRYERDLLTVEETEQWLAERHLDRAAFDAFLLRSYWSRTPSDEAGGGSVPFPEASAAQRQVLAADLLFTGGAIQLARAHGWRMTARAERDGTPNTLETESVRQARLAALGVSEELLPAVLATMGREAAWFDHLVQLEVHYQGVAGGLLTPERRGRRLATQRQPLTRLEMEHLEFRSLQAAREGVLCLREAETTMAELAAECGKEIRQTAVFLGDVPDDARQELLGAQPGDVLSPRETEQGHEICRIQQRQEPDLSDPEVAERIDTDLLTEFFEDRVSRRVRHPSGWE